MLHYKNCTLNRESATKLSPDHISRAQFLYLLNIYASGTDISCDE